MKDRSFTPAAGGEAARATLIGLFEEAVRAVSAEAVMPPTVPISPHGRTLVIAIGKAAAEMMRVAQARAARPLEGLVITRYGHVPKSGTKWPGVEVIEAGHPLPDANSVRAAQRALELARRLEAGDQLIALLSGGGSAVAAAPVAGVTLEDKQQITRELLRSGATIDDINCVRKHLSRIKGGRLAAAAAPASVCSWIISDVPGNDPSLVASGPTVADRTTLETALAILARLDIAVPASVARALRDRANETPAEDSPRLAGAETRILATADMALGAAAARAEAQGLAVTNLGGQLQDEARRLGADHAALALRLAEAGQQRLVLSGGEAGVVVTDPNGRGGPNLEYLLGLAIALDAAPGICAIACDTDGIDGNTDAAGAMVFPDTLERSRALGLDPAACLAANRAFEVFAALGDLVVTGPTLTNVNDFRAILIGAGASPAA